MKLGYLNHEPLPSSETSTEQLVWTVSMLSRHGFDIDLIIPRRLGRYRQAHIDLRDTIRAFYGSRTELMPDNVNLVEVWWPEFARGDLRRGIHDVVAPFRARLGKYDVVYTRDLYALSLALLLGMRSIFETYRTDINRLRSFATFRRFAYTHPKLLGVVTHSRLARDHFRRAGVDDARLLVAHNGYSPAVMQPVRTTAQARESLGIDPDKALVCYAGHVNPKKGVDVLISIAGQLPEAIFLVVGSIPGSEEERHFKTLVEESGVTNMHVLPRVPPADIGAYLYAADCLIIPPTAGPLEQFHRTVLPMKTFLYLAAGRPIVAPDLPDLREVLVDGTNAILVPPDDLGACARALARLLADAPARDVLGKRAREDSAGLTWEARGAKIADFVRRRVSLEG